MRRRADNVSTLLREVEAKRTTIAETETELARQAELAGDAELEQRRSAENADAFADASRRGRAHSDEHRRLGFVLERQRQDLVELERKLERARYNSELAGLEQVAGRRREASRQLAEALGAAVETLPALGAARDEFAAALAHARELCPADVDFEIPANADEAAFPDGVDRLLEALQAGPRRPLANTAGAIEKQRREREQAEDTRMRQAVDQFFQYGNFDGIERLSPDRLPRALELLERKVSEEGPRQSEQFRSQLEQRLERLRELVESMLSAA